MHKKHRRDSEFLEMSHSLESYASSLLTWIQKHEHVQVKKELNAILEEELESSRDFAICHSFWNITDTDSSTTTTTTTMSAYSKILAMSLVPDCGGSGGGSSSTTVGNNNKWCTHPRDFCEAKGDLICKGQATYPPMILEQGKANKKRKEEKAPQQDHAALLETKKEKKKVESLLLRKTYDPPFVGGEEKEEEKESQFPLEQKAKKKKKIKKLQSMALLRKSAPVI